jgi:dihydroorotase
MEKILIKNGTTYDPLTKEKAVKDIALSGGLIVSAAAFKPTYEIDASGCLVIPGLIDFHVHCLASASELGVNPDLSFLPNGVTTCVDAGSAGVSVFESAFQNTINRSLVTVKALLQFCSAGQITGAYPEDQSPGFWNREAIKFMAGKYPGTIKGMKLRFSDNVLEPYKLGIEVLEKAVEFTGELGLPLVIHVNNPGLDIDAIAGLLRKGDVYCHVYAGSRENILDSSGRLRKSVIAARERGVIFDAAAGRRNFLFEVARNAVEQGFPPDIISTDLNKGCYYKQPVVSFPRLLSRYLALGLGLYDVIDRATLYPARWLGCPELASMAEGSPADIALFKVVNKETKFFDTAGNSVMGNEILVPQLTVKAGNIMYAQADFQ